MLIEGAAYHKNEIFAGIYYINDVLLDIMAN